MKDLKDKNSVITGAASGIGRATALELAREGMSVVLADLNQAGMEETAREICTLGGKVALSRTDVSKKEQVRDLVDFAIRELGGIDVLMNNAGVGTMGEMRDLSLEEHWEWIMGINLWGPIYGCHYALPHMIQRGSGHIVNVASGAGLATAPGFGPYCTTKFGLVGMTEVLRCEVARLGIGVSCVCPGLVKTSISETTKTRGVKEMDMGRIFKYWGQKPEKTAKKIVQGIKKNRGLLILTVEAKLLYYTKRFSPRFYSAMGLLMARSFGRYRVESL